MRLFTAIDLPACIEDALAGVIVHLRPAARIHWSPRENFHITTKFIGEWPEERLDELLCALDGLAPRDGIPIEVRGLGWFPNPHSPRIFWAGVKAPPALPELARETDTATTALGIPPETRSFSPHLTLARIKEPLSLAALRQEVARLPSDEFGTFVADRFVLYRSDLRPSGSVYSKIAEFVLART